MAALFRKLRPGDKLEVGDALLSVEIAEIDGREVRVFVHADTSLVVRHVDRRTRGRDKIAARNNGVVG